MFLCNFQIGSTPNKRKNVFIRLKRIAAEEPCHRKVTSWTQPSEEKERRCTVRLFGTNSLKEGAVWRVDPFLDYATALLGSRPLNASRPNSRYAAVGEAVSSPCRAEPNRTVRCCAAGRDDATQQYWNTVPTQPPCYCTSDTKCTMFGVLDHFWPPVIQCYSTKDAGQIANWFIYNLHVRNYSHLFHSYTFTQFTNTTL
jgi:hypothetical protein